MLSALKFSFNTLRGHRCNHGNQCATKHTASKQHFGAMSSFCRTEKQRLNFKVLLMPIGLKPEGLQLSELSNRWWQDAVKLLHFIQGNLATKTTAYSEQTNLQAFQLLLVVVTKMQSCSLQVFPRCWNDRCPFLFGPASWHCELLTIAETPNYLGIKMYKQNKFMQILC